MTGVLIALFWAVWYWISGSVPVVTSVQITESWTYILPFGISRWWDILIGPMWSSVIILILTNSRLKQDENLIFGLIYGLIFGLVVSLIALIKLIVDQDFYEKIGNWLTAKD